MDAGGSGHLCNPHQRALHLIRRHHHNIRQFVNDDDDVRQYAFARSPAIGVVGFDVTRADLFQFFVATIHLHGGPLQNAYHLLDIGHHFTDQMGNTVVAGQFNALGVNHYKAELVGRIMKKEGTDDGVDADGFTRPRGAGDEQVRHT